MSSLLRNEWIFNELLCRLIESVIFCFKSAILSCSSFWISPSLFCILLMYSLWGSLGWDIWLSEWALGSENIDLIGSVLYLPTGLMHLSSVLSLHESSEQIESLNVKSDCSVSLYVLGQLRILHKLQLQIFTRNTERIVK